MILILYSTKIKFRKKGQMDFNLEIPFEHRAPIGFYDVNEEKARPSRQEKLFGRSLQSLDGDKSAKEEAERKNDAKKRKIQKDKGDQPDVSNKLARLAEEKQISKRAKLNLPLPQVSENELEQVNIILVNSLSGQPVLRNV